MSIPTMTFDTLRDIIANPENMYNTNNSYRGDSNGMKQFTLSAQTILEKINSGDNLFGDDKNKRLIDERNERDKNTPSIYISSEMRRGLD